MNNQNVRFADEADSVEHASDAVLSSEVKRSTFDLSTQASIARSKAETDLAATSVTIEEAPTSSNSALFTVNHNQNLDSTLAGSISCPNKLTIGATSETSNLFRDRNSEDRSETENRYSTTTISAHDPLLPRSNRSHPVKPDSYSISLPPPSKRRRLDQLLSPSRKPSSSTNPSPTGATSHPPPDYSRILRFDSSPIQAFLQRDSSGNYIISPDTTGGVTSPLFFSSSSRQSSNSGIAVDRPPLPRFSSGEAGQIMLARAQDGEEEARFRIVTLPRGSLSDLGSVEATLATASGNVDVAAGTLIGITPQTPGGQASILGLGSASGMSRTSSEKFSTWNQSPDERSDRVESIRILSQIGVIELLEQDSRPVFMIDLADVHNTPKSLHIIFANSALRACPSLFDSIQLRPESPYVLQHSEKSEGFYKWLLTYGTESEASEMQEHSFGGAVWTCSTLRGRLRIISATQTVHSLSETPANLPNFSSRPSTSAAQSRQSHRTPVSAQIFANEPTDYFGPGTFASPVIDSPKSNSRKGGSADEVLRDTLGFPSGHDQNLEDDAGFFDWTRFPSSEDLPPHIQFARSVDWATTALGPMSDWPSPLRQMSNLIMASPHPASFYWGPELVAIYNEAYVSLAGQKHPKLMGQRYSDAWEEIWDQLEPVFQDAMESGRATMKDDDRLFINRFNYLEEAFFSWSIIPIVGSDGSVVGLYNPAFENTKRKIAERRMITLREVGERTALARDVKGFWQEVRLGLDTNQWDTPFALLYSVSEDSDSDASSVMSGSLFGSKQCFLEGSLGVPDGHLCAPKQMDLKSGTEGFCPLFQEAMKADGPIIVRITGAPQVEEDQNNQVWSRTDPDDMTAVHLRTVEMPYEMLDGIEWRGFGDVCRSLVVCKVQPTTGDNILGFVVLGVNPRRPYDEDYNLFVLLLTRQIATSLASVVLFEEEIRRGQRAAQLAALDRIQLSAQLAARTQEARDLEIRFSHMAELSPAGLFIANSEGKISYCNDSWYEISGIPKDPVSVDRWIEFVIDSDQERVRGIWSKLLRDHEPTTAEFCFTKLWTDHMGHQLNTWVLFSAHPEVITLPNGTTTQVRSLFCNLTDISSQKRAQEFEKQKMEEALEMKRQQENFIDITSHEMRNPLSAILQCADDITVSLSEVLEKDEEKQILSKSESESLGNSIDAAETIILCAQHQKRIVDDVLTLSKLDSHMLVVCPVDVQPLNIMSRVLKMFEGETTSAGITLQMIVDDSFRNLALDWVKIDPQRVSQVLINLMSNAIKFTSNQQRLAATSSPQPSSRELVTNVGEPHTNSQTSGRSIIVTIAAYTQEPSSVQNPVVQYFPHRRTLESNNSNLSTSSSSSPTSLYPPFFNDASGDWGSGEQVFLQFAVTDTGPGLKDSEKKLLFNRFTQASPRTHVTYGGSGLGLFISRELAELQGGKIGVASEHGKGSTFAFYVKCRKGREPTEEKDKELAIPADLKNIAGMGEGKWTKGRRSVISTGASAAESGTESETEKPVEVKETKEVKRNGVLSVLVVEDNIVNQRVLQKQLQSKGYIVHLANHGGEALEILRRSRFWAASTDNNSSSEISITPSIDLHVVLMDQEMPVMDGLECTKVIRDWEKQGMINTHVPIIGVTANARQQQINSLLDAGMDDVVTKPFRIVELIPKIQDLDRRFSG